MQIQLYRWYSSLLIPGWRPVHRDNRTVLIDTNLAVTIDSTGAAIGIWRLCENTKGTVCEDQCCTFPHLLTASNWKDPATYVPHSDRQIFKGIKPFGAE